MDKRVLCSARFRAVGDVMVHQRQLDRYTDSGIILDFSACRLRKGGFSIENVRALPTYCWRRDDRIQTLCSKKYLDKAPEEMDGDTWLRLKESYAELRELIDKSIPMISR